MLVRHGELNRAQAAEAVAKAKVEVAARGIERDGDSETTTRSSSAQRNAANTQTSVQEAEQFLRRSPASWKRRRGGSCRCHQGADRSRSSAGAISQEARLAVEKARIALGVLIFPDFSVDFTVVDDLQEQPRCCPR